MAAHTYGKTFDDPPAQLAAVCLDTLPALPPFETIRQHLGADEIGDARLLAALYGDRLRFYPFSTHGWYAWAGERRRWEQVDESLIQGLIAEHVAGAYRALAGSLTWPEIDAAAKVWTPAHAERDRSSAIAHQVAARLTKLHTFKRLEAVAKLARTYHRIGGTR